MFGMQVNPAMPGAGGMMNQSMQQPCKVPNTQRVPVSAQKPYGDTVSGISWTSSGAGFAVSCWDSTVRFHMVQPSAAPGVPAAVQAAEPSYNHQGPALSVTWSPDGTSIASGGADCTIKLWQPQYPQNPARDVGRHEKAVTHLSTCPELGLIVSGSLDGTIKFWDLRQSNATNTIPLGGACVALDICQNMVAAAGMGSKVVQINGTTTGYQNQRYDVLPSMAYMFDIRNPAQNARAKGNTPPKGMNCPIRSVGVMRDLKGCVWGALDARGTIEWTTGEESYSFRCHRVKQNNYNNQQNSFPLHAVTFNCKNTFATCGGDGQFFFWCQTGKAKLFPSTANQPGVKPVDTMHGNAITACSFSPDARNFVYAVGYDWLRGSMERKTSPDDGLYIKGVSDTETNPKPKQVTK